MSHPLIYVPTRRILSPAECLGGYPTPRGADGIGVGVGCRLGLRRRRAFTPASDPLLAAWYEAVDVPATLVKATQPTLVNGDFDAGDIGWTKGTDWSIGGGVASHALGAGSSLYQAVLIVGNYYSITYDVSSYTQGACRSYVGGGSAGTFRTATGSYAESRTCLVDTLLAFYSTNIGVLSVDNVTATNLSRTRWNPTAGSLGGYRSQATAAAQFWASTTLLGTHFAVQYDGTADYDVSSLTAAAWNALHQSGAAFAFVFKPAAAGAGVDTLYDTCNGTATNHGITIDYDTAAETLRLLVANGSGTFVVNQSIAAAKGVAHYVELAWSAADGFSLRVDGGAASTGALVGAMSAADATATLNTGRKSGGTDFYAGLLGDLIVTLDATAAMAAQAGAWLKAEYGL